MPGALQSSAAALSPVAGLGPLPATGITHLAPDTAANMARWAPDVRAMLLQASFAPYLATTCDPSTRDVTVSYAGAALWTAARPSAATLAVQVGHVRNYIDQRGDRGAEVMAQLGDFSAFFGIILGLSGARNAKTYELLAHVLMLSGAATMLPKHMLAIRRPDEIDTRVMPLVATPCHGAYPSGHATQAFAMATVLAALIRSVPGHFPDMDKRIDLLYRQAHRIAVNRTVAGVHYPMDSKAGALLGLQLGRVMTGLMAGGATGPALILNPNTEADRDFTFADIAPHLIPAAGGTTLAAHNLFGWIWAQARAEFALTTTPGV